MKDPFASKTTSVKGRTIDDLTINFSLLGVKIRKQLAKILLRKGGAWVSLAFAFREYKEDYSDFDAPEVMLANFKSDGEFYTRQNYFIIKDKDMARDVIKFIKDWFNI